jgi:putative AlgH/UPF0301 family transcriptional regulator
MGRRQLEEELRQDSWVLSSPVGALLDPAPERRLWKLILRQVRPQLATWRSTGGPFVN